MLRCANRAYKYAFIDKKDQVPWTSRVIAVPRAHSEKKIKLNSLKIFNYILCIENLKILVANMFLKVYFLEKALKSIWLSVYKE